MKSTIQCVVLVIVVLALVYVNSFTHFFPQRLTLKGNLITYLVAYILIWLPVCDFILTFFSRHYENAGSNLFMKDYPKPNVENTDNYRTSQKLSSKFQEIR